MNLCNSDVWSGSAAALLGVAFGFGLSWIQQFWFRCRARRAHLAALGAEIDYCDELAATYERDNVHSPSYRLPVLANLNSLPPLLADGVLNSTQVRSLQSFYTEVDALNRGLDQTHEFRDPSRKSEFDDEVRRNHLKAQNILDRYPSARQAVKNS
jgi:hypothetical protein